MSKFCSFHLWKHYHMSYFLGSQFWTTHFPGIHIKEYQKGQLKILVLTFSYVLQVCFAFLGASGGPQLGMLLLAAIFPRANAKVRLLTRS